MAEEPGRERTFKRVDFPISCDRCHVIEYFDDMVFCDECYRIFCKFCVEVVFAVRRVEMNTCRSCSILGYVDDVIERQDHEDTDKIIQELASAKTGGKLEVTVSHILPSMHRMDSLEDIETKIKTCRYVGCEEIIFPFVSGIAPHEDECFFGPYYCSKLYDEKCGFRGTLLNFVKHFWLDHNGKMNETSFRQSFTDADICKDSEKTEIIDYCNEKRFFILRRRIDTNNRNVFWALQLLGPSRCAKKYSYKITLSKNGSKLSQTEICLNHVWNKEQIYYKKKCIFIPFECFQTYFNAFPQVSVTFQIKNLVDDYEMWDN